jgi:hypothetical protein
MGGKSNWFHAFAVPSTITILPSVGLEDQEIPDKSTGNVAKTPRKGEALRNRRRGDRIQIVMGFLGENAGGFYQEKPIGRGRAPLASVAVTRRIANGATEGWYLLTAQHWWVLSVGSITRNLE